MLLELLNVINGPQEITEDEIGGWLKDIRNIAKYLCQLDLKQNDMLSVNNNCFLAVTKAIAELNSEAVGSSEQPLSILVQFINDKRMCYKRFPDVMSDLKQKVVDRASQSDGFSRELNKNDMIMAYDAIINALVKVTK